MFEVKKDMAKPVYVYYELSNFFQNHRTYVKSRSNDQLAGGVSPARPHYLRCRQDFADL